MPCRAGNGAQTAPPSRSHQVPRVPRWLLGTLGSAEHSAPQAVCLGSQGHAGGPSRCCGCWWLATGQPGCVWPRQAGSCGSQGRQCGTGARAGVRSRCGVLRVVCATTSPCPPALLGPRSSHHGEGTSLLPGEQTGDLEAAPPWRGVGSSRSTAWPTSRGCTWPQDQRRAGAKGCTVSPGGLPPWLAPWALGGVEGRCLLWLFGSVCTPTPLR